MKHVKRFCLLLAMIVTLFTVVSLVFWSTGELFIYLRESGYSLFQMLLIYFGGMAVVWSALMTYMWNK